MTSYMRNKMKAVLLRIGIDTGCGGIHGALFKDGSFEYIHDGSETTSDSFTYTVSDGNGGSDVGTVNITVNAIAAGFIETDIWEGVPDEARELVLSLIPLGRKGEAEIRLGSGRIGRRLANRSRPFRKPSKPCSGRIDAEGSSHFGPPTAPNRTASEFLQASRVSFGRGF